MTLKMKRLKRDKDLYSYKENGVTKFAYRYRYRNAQGKWTEKSKRNIATENDAYHELLAIKANVMDGEYSSVNAQNLTVSKWIDQYIESKRNEWKPNTLTNRILYADKHIKTLIGDQKLVKLDRVTYVRLFINPMLEKYTAGTVKAIHDFFKEVVNAAVDAEILKRNRFRKIQIKRAEKPIENFLTPSQLATVIAGFKEEENAASYMMCLLLAHTGMRIGEALGIQWSDIDFENNTISIKRTRDRYGPRTPKTKNSFRTITIPTALSTELQKYKTFCKKTMLMHGLKLKQSDYVVISNDTGLPYGPTSFRCVLRRVEKKTKIYVRAHTFRHTYASISIANGVDIVSIAKTLGNTPNMIYKVYAHVIDQQSEKVSNIISAALENHQ